MFCVYNKDIIKIVKSIVKIPSINLLYSKEYETLLTSSKMACSDMMTCNGVSRLLGIVTRVEDVVWRSYRCTYIITG